MSRKKDLHKLTIYETGNKNLDYLLDGGLPVSEIINIAGSSSVGKTTLLLQTAKNLIKKYNKNVYYIDIDGGVTVELVESLGLTEYLYDENSNSDGPFYLLNMSTIEQILDIVDKVAKDRNTGFIVVDSEPLISENAIVNGMSPLEYHKEIVNESRKWREYANKFKAIIRKSHASMVIVSQLRYDNTVNPPKLNSSACRGILHMSTKQLHLSKLEIYNSNAIIKIKNVNNHRSREFDLSYDTEFKGFKYFTKY